MGAKERHETVTDEFRHVATVLADDAAHAHAVLVQHAHQHLGAEGLAERGECDEVGEHDRHVLAFGDGRLATGNDAVDDGPGREARKGRLQALELACRDIQARAQPPPFGAQAL